MINDDGGADAGDEDEDNHGAWLKDDDNEDRHDDDGIDQAGDVTWRHPMMVLMIMLIILIMMEMIMMTIMV